MLKRLISLVMILALVITPIFPSISINVTAIELNAGEFNPVTGEVRLDFKIQFTQEVSIEVLVDDEHFGWLIKNEELTGYDGALVSHDPCSSYTVPEGSDETHSAGTASNEELRIEEQKDEEGNPLGEGYYSIYWSGSIEGKPVVSVNPNMDQYKLKILIKPQGYPDKGKTECSDPEEDVHDGEDWIWPQQYQVHTELDFDYSTILGTNGLEDLMQLRESSLSYELILKQMKNISNWGTVGMLEDAYEMGLSLDEECADPVNMIDGSYVFSVVDLKLESEYPLAFERAYNSRGHSGALGKGFTHSFEYKLTEEKGYVHIYLPGGEELIFLRLRDFETSDYYTVQNRDFKLENKASGGYSLKYKRGGSYEFDASGNLVEIKNDIAISVYSLQYASGRLIKIIGDSGYFICEYNGDKLSTVRDSAGRSVNYEYDGDNLTRFTNADGDSCRYEYDDNGYISAAIDYEGNEYLKNTYDERGRVINQVFINGGASSVHGFTYDDENLINTYINPMGKEIKYHYDEYRRLQFLEDEHGRTQSGYESYMANYRKDNQSNEIKYEISGNNVTKRTYPDGSVENSVYSADGKLTDLIHADGGKEKFTYNPNGALSSYTDENGHVMNYTYNAKGLVTSVSNALGHKTTRGYDSKSRLIYEEDAEGGKVTFDYDDAGRITALHVKLTNAKTASTSFEYSEAGKLLKKTDPLGRITQYKYDKNGSLIETVDPAGNSSKAEYGENGALLKEIDARGNETLYTYAGNSGLLESVTDPEGHTTAYTYNRDGRLIAERDPEGNLTRYGYDSLGRVVKRINPLGKEAVYVYDSMGQLISVTDENGNKTSYKYDKGGRIKEIKDAENNTRKYKYDLSGNLLKITDANGNSISFSYDGADNLITRVDAEGNSTRYEYDKAGRRVRTIDAKGGAETVSYDLAGNISSVTDPKGNTAKYIYDDAGRLVEMINPDNSSKKYSYDTLDNVTEETGTRGEKTKSKYDKNGNLIERTDPMKNTTRYSYNKNDLLKTITYADHSTKKFTYTAIGDVSSEKDENGELTRYSYDALGRLAKITDAENHVTEFFYDETDNIEKVTVDGHIVNKRRYDKADRLIENIDGLGNSSSYRYDGEGNIISSSDREGNATEYRYDKNYELISVKDPMGFKQRMEYDSLGRKIKDIDQNGYESRYTYDENGNLTEIRDALSGEFKYQYDAMDRLVKMTDAVGAETRWDYDASGNEIKNTDAAGGIIRKKYDWNNNLIEYRNRENEWCRYEYDKRNRLIKKVNELNHVELYEYDGAGSMIARTDGRGNKTTYEYDALGRLVKKQKPLSGSTLYSYNRLGKISSVSTEGGGDGRNIARYEYDNAGNLLAEISDLGVRASYTYNKEGKVITKTDRNGNLTTYEYDKLQRVIKKVNPDGESHFTYDGVGNMLTAKSSAGKVSFTYDELYRVVKVTGEDEKEVSYSYDAMGRRTAIKYPGGETIKTAYDDVGGVISIEEFDGGKIQFTSDKEGRVTKESYSDGSSTEYDYNAAGLITLQKEVTKDHKTRRQVAYTYDDAENLISENRTGVGISKKDEIVRYYYDSENRLIKSSRDGKVKKYSYDKAGNIISCGEDNYTYDSQNRLMGKTSGKRSISYEYDAAGNLTKETDGEKETRYRYDSENRLIKGEKSDGQSSSYVYNALGVRIQNTQIRKNKNKGYENFKLDNGSEFLKDYLKALSDGRATNQRVWETEVGTTVQNDYETVKKNYTVDYLSVANRDILVDEEGSYLQKYVYDEHGRCISGEFSHTDGTKRGSKNKEGKYGENISSDNAVDKIKKVWFHSNHINSKLFATSGAGETIAHMERGAWGMPDFDTYTDINYSGLESMNDYTGYTLDECLGLYFAQNRFYDPENMRFIQEDIIKDGDNWYTYVENNPLVNIDWYGLAKERLYKALAKVIKRNAKREIVDNKGKNILKALPQLTPRNIYKGTEMIVKEAVTISKMDSPIEATRYLAHQLFANETIVNMTKSKTHEADMYDLGFERDKKKLYHTRQDSWQRYPGYLEVFDEIFHIGTHMKKDNFDFNFEGENLRVWIWKGDYLNLGAGAELAIYRTVNLSDINAKYIKNDKVNALMNDSIEKDGIHYVVDDRYRLNMSMKIWHKKEKKVIGEYSPGKKIWWLTSFNPDYQSVMPCDLKVTYKIDFSRSGRDKKMFAAFMEGEPKNRDKWKFDKKRYTAKLVF